MCSALTTVPCGCVGRRGEGKEGCKERGRRGWLMPASFLVTAFRYDQNKHSTSEAQGQLPNGVSVFFCNLFISFLFLLPGNESNTHKKKMNRRVG